MHSKVAVGPHPPIALQALPELYKLARHPPLVPVPQQVVQLPLQIPCMSQGVLLQQLKPSVMHHAGQLRWAGHWCTLLWLSKRHLHVI